MIRSMKYIVSLIGFLFLSSVAFSQNVTFEASAPRVVTVGEPFRVEFSVNAKPEGFSAPIFEGVDVLAGPTTSQSSSASIVFGSGGGVTQTFTQIYTYVLLAKSAGTITIPVAGVKVDGKTYSTRATPVEVIDGGSQQQAAAPAGESTQSQQPISTSSSIADDDILLRVIVDKTNVYKGQPVKAIFKLYTRQLLSGTEGAKYPAFNGFWTHDLNVDGYRPQRETYNNKVYDTHIIKEVLLYPQQSGNFTIEPFSLTLIAEVMVQNRRQSIFDDFFGGGPSTQSVRKTVVSQPVQIRVKDFPAGAPTSFNGAVGQFQLTGDVSENTLFANSSGVYTLRIAGTGNLSLIAAPDVELPSTFEKYNMRTSESLNPGPSGISGYRQFEYPFIPRAEGVYTIDPIEFSYFDPQQEIYRVLTVPPVTVDVKADSTSLSPGRGMVSGITREDLRILDRDIRFIRIGNADLYKKTVPFVGTILYFGILFLLATITVLTYRYLKKYITEQQNTTLIRRKRANKVALLRLKAAQQYMDAGNQRHFYEEMLKALWGYMSDKLNIPVANLTKDNMREELQRRGVAQDQVSRFIELISECEYAQYAPAGSGQMTEVYNAAVDILSRFESLIKK